MEDRNVFNYKVKRSSIPYEDQLELKLEDKQTPYERFESQEDVSRKTIDHSDPVIRFGSNDMSNLGLMPKSLNSSKNAR